MIHRPSHPYALRPGELALADLGGGPLLPHPATGKPRKAWLFVLTLAYSLHFYAEFLWDQSVEAWLRAHQNAWEFLGGVPAGVCLANHRTAIIRQCSLWGSPAYRSYQEFAQAWGFRLAFTLPPQGLSYGAGTLKKLLPGAWESGSLADANRHLITAGLGELGNQVHPGTHQVPLMVFAEKERTALQPLPRRRPELAVWAQATLHPNCMLAYEGSYYSAPYEFVRQKLDLRVGERTVAVFRGLRQVAVHARARRSGQRRMNPDHFPPDRTAYRMKAPTRCRARAEKVGPWCFRFIEELFSRDVLSRLKAAQGALHLGKRYGSQRLEDACRRAVAHDQFDYRDLKLILERGLDQAPLDETDSGQLLFPGLYTPRSKSDGLRDWARPWPQQRKG